MQRLAEEFHTLLVAGSNPAPATKWLYDYENALWDGICFYLFGTVGTGHYHDGILVACPGLAIPVALELDRSNHLWTWQDYVYSGFWTKASVGTSFRTDIHRGWAKEGIIHAVEVRYYLQGSTIIAIFAMIMQSVMTKRYPKKEKKPQVLEKPAVAYGISGASSRWQVRYRLTSTSMSW